MSERMIPIPFRELMQWISAEYQRDGSAFGVYRPFRAGDKTLPIFGETIENPCGPAAGPHTQLAQNIVAGYFAGARFFELKTVQKMDGAELAACINRPCILAEDECYNCEWSTELTVEQAFGEYVKAWCACKMIARLYGLGSPDGFVFNMSVGYDLDGIKGPKVNAFLDGMMDASDTPVFRDCIAQLHALFPKESAFIDSISPRISRSVTVSTLHGCPPEEIERIASYLLTEKGLHTYVKCNPTLLGYETARSVLDEMGYDYISFDDRHFREDLQYEDAIPMFRRLQALAGERGLEFGLKLSNTFPVDVKQGELPSEEMYMAGKSLYPLTTLMAARIAKEFDGRIRLSYAGGADAANIAGLFAAGVWPITMATTLLKPGGYQRLTQIAEKLEELPFAPFTRVDYRAMEAIALSARRDPLLVKAVKPLPRRKLWQKVPLLDCFTAPCRGGCPIGQDIPGYLELLNKGDYAGALEVILRKNPLPSITGTICAHPCMEKCTRNYYEAPVDIRGAKLTAQKGYDTVLSRLKPPAPADTDVRAAVVGGGPAGMAAAFFLARAGVPVTLFEKEQTLGGVVRHVIPAFRISDEAVERDAEFLRRLGADLRLGTPAPSLPELRRQGYTHIFYAVGAQKAGTLDIPGNVISAVSWLRDLRAGKDVALGHVAVVGGGNTAMDTARAALRAGAASVTLVYRRTKKYMPADAEELELALAEGVTFLELAAPVEQKDGRLLCKKLRLGEPDESGRRSPVETGETLEIPCDTVLAAVGEKVDGAFFAANGIETDRAGCPDFITNQPGVYAGGDAFRGPATVVEGIADAAGFARAVLGDRAEEPLPAGAYPESLTDITDKKGVLRLSAPCQGERCLQCAQLCQSCTDVCPNRANVAVVLPDGSRQILHIDRMCNECGNCAAFCPYDSAPFRDKFTLFHDRAGFDESPENQGFLPLGGRRVLLRLDGAVRELDLDDPSNGLPAGLEVLMLTVLSKYPYLLG